MTTIVVDRLRIRGPQGRRMARIAARLLPDALDAACADIDDGGGDLVLASLHVVLDLDPDAYDDDTLALLWADRIRGAALAAGARVRSGQSAAPGSAAEPSAPGAGPPAQGTGSGAGRTGTARSSRGAAGPPPALAGAGTGAASPGLLLIVGEWLARDAVPDDAQQAAALKALADQAVAAAIVEALPPPSAQRLLRLLLPRVDQPTAHGPRGAEVGKQTSIVRAHQAAVPDVARAIAEAARIGAVTSADRSGSPERAGAATAAATAVGGLVLLSPWLAAYCRSAVAARGDLPAEQARTAALALVAEPADPTVLLDPLVALLAGDGPEEYPPDSPADIDPAEAAEAVLRRFAGLIHGFERSTPAFVRREWIARTGLLDATADPVRLELQTRPLDLALGSLPYPTGLLRLPWTPAIAVRFVP